MAGGGAFRHIGGRRPCRCFDMGMGDTAYPYTVPPDGDLVCATGLMRAGNADRCGPDTWSGATGAHSTVREQAGIAFTGDRYPQTFLLADADADGLKPVTAHVWLVTAGSNRRAAIDWQCLEPQVRPATPVRRLSSYAARTFTSPSGQSRSPRMDARSAGSS